ncbi:site-specific integrase [Methylocystis sp.]|uniref:site-specific integrase n=1 Tax=Methylocystis sp. TaxID=1911079 RepID=UPI0025EF0C46|nr:site-specific integrase [Methylocystis sp.]
MPVLKLSKKSVDGLAPRDRAFIAFDADLAGFGVRVMPSGVKSWVVEYRPNGGGRSVSKRRVTLGKTTALTPDQARRAAAGLLARVRLGADPAAERAEQREALTISELIDVFDAQHIGTMLKPGTAVSHRVATDVLRGAHGSVKAGALTRAKIATLHAQMADRPYAANRAVAVWAKLFAWAAERGHVPEGHNPAKGLKKYREQGKERFLTSEELARLGTVLTLAETRGLPWHVDEIKPNAKHAPKESNRRRILDPFAVAAIRLLILTGARLREILHAQWSQVDLERGVIFLSDSKTGKKPIYLSAAAQAVLASLPRIEGNSHIIAGAKEGAPRADLKKPWAAVKRTAGLEGVRLHDLRHSFASFGAGASLGLPIIGKLLGHSQAATTHRYAHLDADPLRRAVDTIGTTISAAMEGNKGGDVVPVRKLGTTST